jgi:hypothetical protein
MEAQTTSKQTRFVILLLCVCAGCHVVVGLWGCGVVGLWGYLTSYLLRFVIKHCIGVVIEIVGLAIRILAILATTVGLRLQLFFSQLATALDTAPCRDTNARSADLYIYIYIYIYIIYIYIYYVYNIYNI